MKRIGNIYDQISSYTNCRNAIIKASIGKRKRGATREVLDNLDRYTKELQSLLINQSYKPKDYKIMVVRDRLNGKVRETQVPSFYPDLCIQHTLMLVLIPIFEKRMYYWSSGCRVGKGNTHAKKGVERATMQRTKKARYAVKLDIQKCYPSIKGDLLYAQMERVIKDKQALWLIKTIIDSSEGLPIGSYTSAWFCNWFITPVDRLIKDTHKIHCYVRFIDDMVLIDTNKRKLIKCVKEAQAMLQDMGLQLHSGWNVFKIRTDKHSYKGRCIDFVGYQYAIGYTRLRKRSALTIMRQSRKIKSLTRHGKPISYKMASGFLSRMGQAKHCDCRGLWTTHIDTLPIAQLKGVVRHESKKKRQTTYSL